MPAAAAAGPSHSSCFLLLASRTCVHHARTTVVRQHHSAFNDWKFAHARTRYLLRRSTGILMVMKGCSISFLSGKETENRGDIGRIVRACSWV
jgi:hypothetical protein